MATKDDSMEFEHDEGGSRDRYGYDRLEAEGLKPIEGLKLIDFGAFDTYSNPWIDIRQQGIYSKLGGLRNFLEIALKLGIKPNGVLIKSSELRMILYEYNASDASHASDASQHETSQYKTPQHEPDGHIRVSEPAASNLEKLISASITRGMYKAYEDKTYEAGAGEYKAYEDEACEERAYEEGLEEHEAKPAGLAELSGPAELVELSGPAGLAELSGPAGLAELSDLEELITPEPLSIPAVPESLPLPESLSAVLPEALPVVLPEESHAEQPIELPEEPLVEPPEPPTRPAKSLSGVVSDGLIKRLAVDFPITATGVHHIPRDSPRQRGQMHVCEKKPAANGVAANGVILSGIIKPEEKETQPEVVKAVFQAPISALVESGLVESGLVESSLAESMLDEAVPDKYVLAESVVPKTGLELIKEGLPDDYISILSKQILTTDTLGKASKILKTLADFRQQITTSTLETILEATLPALDAFKDQPERYHLLECLFDYLLVLNSDAFSSQSFDLIGKVRGCIGLVDKSPLKSLTSDKGYKENRIKVELDKKSFDVFNRLSEAYGRRRDIVTHIRITAWHYCSKMHALLFSVKDYDEKIKIVNDVLDFCDKLLLPSTPKDAVTYTNIHYNQALFNFEKYWLIMDKQYLERAEAEYSQTENCLIDVRSQTIWMDMSSRLTTLRQRMDAYSEGKNEHT